MSDISISLNRENGRWTWRLLMSGTVHDGPRPEDTAEFAALEADTFRRQLELAQHFRKMRAERKNANSNHRSPRA